MLKLRIVEKEVSDISTDLELMRRQLYLVMTNLAARNDAMADVNFNEFKTQYKELGNKLEKMQRKMDDFEAANGG